MKRILGVVLACVMVFSGCGENTAASGNIVSGGSVSGSAVCDKNSAEGLRYCGGYSSQCSEDYFYRGRQSGGTVIEQMDFHGKMIKEWELDLHTDIKNPGVDVELVDDGMIYFSVFGMMDEMDDEDSRVELWQVPLLQDGESEELSAVGAEKIFMENGWLEIYFINRDYICYYINGFYREYDRKTGKEIPVEKRSDRKYCTPEMHGHELVSMAYSDLRGKFVFLASAGKTGEEYPAGFYIHRVGSGRVEKLQDTIYSKYLILPYGCFGEDRCYYTFMGEMEGNGVFDPVSYGKQEIWSYAYESGEKTCMITKKDIRRWMEGQKLMPENSLDFTMNQIYLYNNRLYIEIYENRDWLEFGFWMSMDVRDRSLRYEKDLTEFAKEKEENTWFFEAYGSQLRLDETIYDLNTGETARPKKNSEEYFRWDGESEEW